jgi:RimJ/RimL family protein N-acetyltransferase
MQPQSEPQPLPQALPKPLRLAGHAIVLREWEASDVGPMAVLLDDPEVAQWTPLASPFDLEAAERYFRAGQERRAGGKAVHFVVTRDGTVPLGDAGAFLRGEDGRQVELYYAIGAAYRRQGLATAGLRLLVSFARGQLAARRVTLRIEPENEASRGVARKAGFRIAEEVPQEVATDADGTQVVLDVWELAAGTAARSATAARCP